MNEEEAKHFTQRVLAQYHSGQWEEISTGGLWAFSINSPSALSVITQKPGNVPFVSVTCGLALDVPIDRPLFDFLNTLNESAFFGASYYELGGQGGATVKTQHLIPIEALSMDHPPTLRLAALTINELLQRSTKASEELVAECGGRYFPAGWGHGLWLST